MVGSSTEKNKCKSRRVESRKVQAANIVCTFLSEIYLSTQREYVKINEEMEDLFVQNNKCILFNIKTRGGGAAPP